MRRMITTKQEKEIGKLKYIGVENNALSISYDTTGNDDFANIKLFSRIHLVKHQFKFQTMFMELIIYIFVIH